MRKNDDLGIPVLAPVPKFQQFFIEKNKTEAIALYFRWPIDVILPRVCHGHTKELAQSLWRKIDGDGVRARIEQERARVSNDPSTENIYALVSALNLAHKLGSIIIGMRGAKIFDMSEAA